MRKRRTHMNRAIDNLLAKLDAEIASHESSILELCAVRTYLLTQTEMVEDDVPEEPDEVGKGELEHVAPLAMPQM